MLSKSQILKARRAVERMYSGSCTVIEYRKMKNEKTKLMEWQEVTMLENQPCRLSFDQNQPVTQSVSAAAMDQKIKLFLAPELVIKPGSKIIVTQNGVTTEYTYSSVPAVYATHQEIVLELFEEWT